jgi:hypothetical protein
LLFLIRHHIGLLCGWGIPPASWAYFVIVRLHECSTGANCFVTNPLAIVFRSLMGFALLAPLIWFSAYCMLLATLLKMLEAERKKKEAL